MNFKAYDILSSLVPGFLILLPLLAYLGIDYNKDSAIAYIAIAFFIGFIVNTLSSWLEGLYIFTWGGKPSNRLLSGKTVWKVPFYAGSEVRARLMRDLNVINATNDQLFALAMRYANSKKDSRVEDLNANYAFSRALLTAVMFISFLLLSKEYENWHYYIICLPLIVLLWLRCKQRAYYYAREVLNEYLNKP